MRHFLLSAVFVCVGAAIAYADVPRYDVEAHCDEIAGFGGSYSHEVYNYCLRSEQSAYNALKGDWSVVPGRVRKHCDQIAKFGGEGSYEVLQYCVVQEMEASGSRPTFKY